MISGLPRTSLRHCCTSALLCVLTIVCSRSGALGVPQPQNPAPASTTCSQCDTKLVSPSLLHCCWPFDILYGATSFGSGLRSAWILAWDRGKEIQYSWLTMDKIACIAQYINAPMPGLWSMMRLWPMSAQHTYNGLPTVNTQPSTWTRPAATACHKLQVLRIRSRALACLSYAPQCVIYREKNGSGSLTGPERDLW
jgi:hypothetical protein